MILTVEYDPNAGYVFKDGEAEEWVTKIIAATRRMEERRDQDRDDWVVTVASEMLVDVFRIQVVRGNLSHKELQFKFGDEIIPVDKYGCLKQWPAGFCDFKDNMLEELLFGKYPGTLKI